MKNLITCLVVTVLSSATFADTWTVDDDGKADFDNIQAAVDAASDGDEIVVMPGTYTSTAGEVVNMLGKEIWLHSSAGAEVTIIDGEGTRRGILCDNNETSNTIIEGFAIKNCYSKYSNGGGVRCANANPKLLNLIIENNNSGYTYHDKMAGVCWGSNGNGGGLYAEGGSGILEIINCMFIGNQAEGNRRGAGAYTIGESAGQIHFTDCEFINNYFTMPTNCTVGYAGEGCGAFSNGNVDYSGCTFTNNTTPTGTWITYDGGGLYGGGIISNCTFIDNTSDNGGGLYGGGIVSNCTFIDNVASLKGANAYGGTSYTSCTFSGGTAIEGGGLALLTLNCTVSDCSFSDNIATDLGGSIFIGSSVVDIQNSTFCNSSPNHIEGSWTDNGNNEFFDFCGIGACCTRNQLTCVEAPGIACLQFGLEFLGEGTTCEDNPCPNSCLGDVTGDGLVNTSDILVIISVWGACP
jgi:hypothetical protein